MRNVSVLKRPNYEIWKSEVHLDKHKKIIYQE